MTELRTQGFHHVTLVSSDAQRTLDFYRGTLGLGLVKRTTEDSGVPHLYFGDAPGTRVTVVERRGVPRGAPGVGGVHHLALAADTEESLLKWKRRLTDAGAHVNGPYDRTWFTSLYFTDPDGQILEIATKGPGYALD
ncbi:MAG TPA: VOC family protein, partial [Longimicrobiaceae bacterium]